MKKFGLLTAWLSLFSFLILLNPVGREAEALLNSGREKRNPRMIFVLVDMSGSTNLARQTVYRDGFAKVYQNLDEGDRIMLGTITGRSYIDFKPTVDVVIPETGADFNNAGYDSSFFDEPAGDGAQSNHIHGTQADAENDPIEQVQLPDASILDMRK